MEQGNQILLETKRFLVRRFRESDVDDLYETLSNERVMQYIEPVYTRTKTMEFIMEYGKKEPVLIYALQDKENSKVIGHIIFHSYGANSYEIGWILNQSCWGKKAASEVTEGLIGYAKTLEISELVIECDPEQEATKHIADKYGFQYKGIEDGCCIYRLQL